MSFDLDKINHPKVKFGKTGVLLVNLGTPDSTSWWDIRKYLKEFLSDTRVIEVNPVICFPKGINENINTFIKTVNPHGLSIDYDVNLKKLDLNNNVVFQGGMNPKFLLGNNQKMFREAKKYLDFFKNKPYIFNLGHGILPKTKPENVKKLIEFVRDYNL